MTLYIPTPPALRLSLQVWIRGYADLGSATSFESGWTAVRLTIISGMRPATPMS